MRLGHMFSVAIIMSGYAPSALASPHLSDEDRGIICSVINEALSTFSSIRQDGNPDFENQLAKLEAEAGKYTQMPRKIRCNERSIRLIPQRYGTYINSVIISADRRHVLMSGGYQWLPLDGASGDCLFRYNGSQWQNLGCRVTGVS